MNSEIIRYQNTYIDLLKLNAKMYCDLGPSEGDIIKMLKANNQNVIGVEAPWGFEERTKWARDIGVTIYPGEFFSTNFSQLIPEKVDCFSLIHCIAHLRYPPQLLFEQIYRKLEKGGYFYLSTVNAGALDKVIKLFRGGAITEPVNKFTNMGDEYNGFFNKEKKYMIWDDWMHVKEYRAFELVKMMEEENFKVIDVRHRNNFKHWKTTLMCSIWPHLSEEIIVVGQKK